MEPDFHLSHKSQYVERNRPKLEWTEGLREMINLDSRLDHLEDFINDIAECLELHEDKVEEGIYSVLDGKAQGMKKMLRLTRTNLDEILYPRAWKNYESMTPQEKEEFADTSMSKFAKHWPNGAIRASIKGDLWKIYRRT